MGDITRNEKFATMIKKQFPKAKNVLNIADGKGILSRKLANKDMNIYAVEKKPRFKGNKHKRIIYKQMTFNSNKKLDIDNIDLIVGMHPDEATAEILDYAIINKINFAIVPCCIVGKYSENVSDYKSWINKLSNIAIKNRFNVTVLKLNISGKNLAIIGKIR
jgi:predicted RNA methylase